MKVSGQLHAEPTLSLRKELQYPLNGRLGGPLRPVGRFEKEKSFAPLGN
jgi:hypothetical protein